MDTDSAAAAPPLPGGGGSTAAIHSSHADTPPSPERDAMLSLSASAVLLAAGASEHLGLPLGAFITPAATDRVRQDEGGATSSSSPSPIITQRPPILCSACGAAACHLCGVAPGGRGWTCALCGQGHALSPGDALRLGPVPSWPELDPGGGDFLDVSGGSPTLPAPPAVAAVLVVDAAAGTATATALRAELAAALAQAPPGLRAGVVLAGRGVGVVDAARAAAAAAAAAAGGQDAGPSPAVAVLPGSAGEPADHLVRPLVRTALAPVRGGAAGAAAALVAPLQSEPARGVPPADRPRCLGPAIGVALSILEAAIEQGRVGGLAGSDDGNDADEANPEDGRVEAQTTAPRPATPPPARSGATDRSRAAAEPPPTPVLGQVIVVTAGPPTRGPGAAAADGAAADAFFEGLASRAAGAGVVVDAFALGPGGAAAEPSLSKLAAATGGQCALHAGSATATGGPAAGLAPRLAAALAARVGFGGSVEVRASAPLVPVPVAPPGVAWGATTDEAAGGSVGLARWPLPHPRPGEGAAVWLAIPSPPPPRLVRAVEEEEARGLSPPAAAVQAVVRWVDAATGGVLARVATARVGLLLPGAAGAADAAVAAAARPGKAVLLLAKQLAVDGLGGGGGGGSSRKKCKDGESEAEAGRARLAAFLRDAGRGAGAPAGGGPPRRRWLGGGKGLVRLPPRLASALPAAVYAAACRSPAFAEGVPPGVRRRALGWLASAPPTAAGAALCPRLEVFDHDTASFTPVPALDVALALPRPGAALAVLDAGDEVFVWLGRAVVGGPPTGAAAAALALKRGRDRAAALAGGWCGGRSPPPEVTTVVEGSPASLNVLARLIPAHLDPPAVWAGALPPGLGAGAGWAPAAAWAAAAMRGLLYEDEPGYATWCEEEAGIAVVADGGV